MRCRVGTRCIGILGSWHLRNFFLNKHVSIPYFVVTYRSTTLLTIDLYADFTLKPMKTSFLRAFSNSRSQVHAFVVNIHKRAHQCDSALIALYTDRFSSARNLTVTLKKNINKHKNLCINLLNFRHCNAPSNHRNEDLQALFWLPLGALKRRRSPLVSFGRTRRPCFS